MISTYKKSLLLMYRYIYLIGMVFEPAWGIYVKYFTDGTAQESIILRLLCGLTCGFLGFLTYKEEHFFRYYRIYTLFLIALFTIQRYILLIYNPMNWNYIIDLYTIVILTMITCPTKKDMVKISIIILLVSLFFPQYDYTVFFNLVTVIPLVGALKWVYLTTQEKLEEQSMLNGVKATIASMSHEVNNCIMGINLNTAMLSAGNEEDQEKINNIMQKSNEIGKVLASVQKAFDDKMLFQEHNSLQLVEDVVNLYKTKLKDYGIKISIDNNITDQSIFTSKNQFETILTNLVQNAIDEIKHIDSPRLYIKLYQDNNHVIVQVIDNANKLHGKSHDENQQIFKPFYSSKGINEGKGLGLSISKSLANKLDGELSLTSTIPTTFTLKLKKGK